MQTGSSNNRMSGRCALAEFAWLSDIGRVRSENQDAVAVAASEDGACLLAVVADGLGGYEGGRLAADITVETFLGMLNDPKPERAADRFEALLGCFTSRTPGCGRISSIPPWAQPRLQRSSPRTN